MAQYKNGREVLAAAKNIIMATHPELLVNANEFMTCDNPEFVVLWHVKRDGFSIGIANLRVMPSRSRGRRGHVDAFTFQFQFHGCTMSDMDESDHVKDWLKLAQSFASMVEQLQELFQWVRE